MSPPGPDVQVGNPDDHPDWWPAAPDDPRHGAAWARGSQREGDDVGWVGVTGGPALWRRRLEGGAGAARMNLVDVCAGLTAQLSPDPLLLQQARDAFPVQTVLAANGYDTPVASAGSVDRQQLAELVRGIVAEAERAGAVPGALHLPPGDPLLEIMPELGFHVGWADLYPTLHLPGTGMDDYLTGLGRKRRTNVRREMRALDRGRGTFHRGDAAAPFVPAAAELVSQAYASRDQHIEPIEVVGIYDRLLAAFGDDLLLCLIEVDGVPVASAVLLLGRTDALLYSAGIHAELSREVAGYFNACYYLPIEFAYQHGLRRIHLGPTGSHTKNLRGAGFVPLAAAVPATAEPLVALLSSTDRAVRQQLRELTRVPSQAAEPPAAARPTGAG